MVVSVPVDKILLVPIVARGGASDRTEHPVLIYRIVVVWRKQMGSWRFIWWLRVNWNILKINLKSRFQLREGAVDQNTSHCQKSWERIVRKQKTAQIWKKYIGLVMLNLHLSSIIDTTITIMANLIVSIQILRILDPWLPFQIQLSIQHKQTLNLK